MVTDTAFVQQQVEDIQALTEHVKGHFSSLTETQLNFKAHPDQWSVGQCFDHLLVTNALYDQVFAELAAGTYQHTLWQKMPGLPGMFGRMLIKSLGRVPKSKSKSPKPFRPSSSNIPGDIVTNFLAHQPNLEAKLKKLSELDLDKTIISSPASAMITYSLRDAMTIIVNHEYRHVYQAEQIMKHQAFPSSHQETA
ncbi:MAG: DinB family protein [Bacteroidota bacterium]